jgi:hypothetical protein
MAIQFIQQVSIALPKGKSRLIRKKLITAHGHHEAILKKHEGYEHADRGRMY